MHSLTSEPLDYVLAMCQRANRSAMSMLDLKAGKGATSEHLTTCKGQTLLCKISSITFT